MQIFKSDTGITLERTGEQFPFHLAYHTYGTLNENKDNVKWVFHALTADSNPLDWWSDLFGPGKILDLETDFIVCANMPGSCYGSSGPLENNPDTGEKYFHDFPRLTLNDIVRSFIELKNYLGIQKIKLGLGGSMGGSALLEWSIEEPSTFQNMILIATSASESSWGKAIHSVHKLAIETDPTWKKREINAGLQGLETARGVGMLFYRTHKAFNETQIDDNDEINNYKSDSYIRHQGKKLSARFNAFSYYFLLDSLDTHHVGRNRGTSEEALAKISARTLIIGINSDILYPNEEQEFLHAHIPHSSLHFIESEYGHDGFLIETKKINQLGNQFLQQ